nr:MAG TPA: hypothetical protein [Caudoviricetes sp.]
MDELDYVKETSVVDTMLTKVQKNTYNPFDDYDAWSRWDTEHGYNTPELLAEVIGNTDDALDEVEIAQRQATAINYIIDEGPVEDVWTVCKPTTPTPIRLPTNTQET